MRLTTVLACAVAIAAGTVTEGANVEVAQEVDSHWRGAYDILVRPHDSRLGLEQTAGVVEPNFLGFLGTGGITLDELAAMRALDDVELAAPISFIGMLSTPSASTTIHIPSVPARTTLYEATIRVTTSDGLSQRLIEATGLYLVLGPGGPDHQPLIATDDRGATISVSPDGAVDIGTSAFLPPFTSPVLAVDPVAERSLLGASGSFLDPLAQVAAGGPFTASTFDPSIVLAGFDARPRIGILSKGTTAMRGRPVFPILVSRRVYAPLNASLSVEEVGEPIAGALTSEDPVAQVEEAKRLAGAGRSPIGTVEQDLSDAMRPLRTNPVTLPWPGSAVEAGPVQFQESPEFTDRLAVRPSYTVSPSGSDGTLRFTIQPLGAVGPGGEPPPVTTGEAASVGTEQSYRMVVAAAAPLLEGFVASDTGDQPFVLAPIGEYDLGEFDLPSDPLTYVPLGAYDPPDSALVADAEGHEVGPHEIWPTLNPAGLLQVPPLAITDLSAAAAIRGAAPIDAVRIRVAGLTGFDEDAKAKVERIASMIVAMGLDVDVVAGSSPQTVEVYVPAYDTSIDPPLDLGWVRQHWTTLGAATRVTQGLGTANVALLGLAILALIIVVLGIEVLSAAMREREAAVLVAVGWSRLARARWQTTPSLVAGIVVAVVGVAAWVSLGRGPATLIVIGLVAASFPMAALPASLAAPSNPTSLVGEGRTGRVLRRVPVDGLTAFSLRSVCARPARALVMISAVAAASATTGLGLAIIATLGLRVGPTRLAAALTGQLAPYQLILLALAAAATVTFGVVALRTSVHARRQDLRVLVAAGWGPRDLRGELQRERSVIAVPAALLAALLSWLAASGIPGADPAASAGIAVILALSMIVWGGFVAPAPRIPESARGLG